MAQEYFMYKGYPLVRNGKSIYYGYMSDPYVTQLQILHSTNQNGIDIADKIKIYQISTDEKLSPIDAIVKTSERGSLFEALDLANAWIERSIKEAEKRQHRTKHKKYKKADAKFKFCISLFYFCQYWVYCHMK